MTGSEDSKSVPRVKPFLGNVSPYDRPARACVQPQEMALSGPFIFFFNNNKKVYPRAFPCKLRPVTRGRCPLARWWSHIWRCRNTYAFNDCAKQLGKHAEMKKKSNKPLNKGVEGQADAYQGLDQHGWRQIIR